MMFMTSSLLNPWRCGRPVPMPGSAGGGVASTAILDWRHWRVGRLLEQVQVHKPEDMLDLLRIAHRRIAEEIRPVYSLEERRPVSQVLRRGRGSCSQRLAVLEAVARASGVPTRVRGLLVDGAFWYPRFPRFRLLVPDRVVLAWPEFMLETGWVPVSELFGPLHALGAASEGGFINTAGETLFDAVSRTAVDWDGATAQRGMCPMCDLSANVRADLGHYDSRDALFAEHGQTLCWSARMLGEPVLGRWSAGR